jgi:hypothetical protein
MQEGPFLIKEGGYRKAVLDLYKAGILKKLDKGSIRNEGTRFVAKT